MGTGQRLGRGVAGAHSVREESGGRGRERECEKEGGREREEKRIVEGEREREREGGRVIKRKTVRQTDTGVIRECKREREREREGIGKYITYIMGTTMTHTSRILHYNSTI